MLLRASPVERPSVYIHCHGQFLAGSGVERSKHVDSETVFAGVVIPRVLYQWYAGAYVFQLDFVPAVAKVQSAYLGPNFEASIIASDRGTASGRANLSSPTGGKAYGMPKNASTGVLKSLLSILTPRICP